MKNSSIGRRPRAWKTATGWEVRVLDGAGSVQSHGAAFRAGHGAEQRGVIINGFDAVEQRAGAGYGRCRNSMVAGIPADHPGQSGAMALR
jgi:hypothetical protein